ncbi:MAG: hypothetical protein CK429_35910 [Mycobacterium sp.]|nr:MAG: hypothetical protein CK429_35910 [Mycobacterium sp.]
MNLQGTAGRTRRSSFGDAIQRDICCAAFILEQVQYGRARFGVEWLGMQIVAGDFQVSHELANDVPIRIVAARLLRCSVHG